MNITTSGCGNCIYCYNGQCSYGGQCYGSPQLQNVNGKWCWMPIGSFKEDKMNWRFECQTCAKAKRGYGLGVVFPCNEDKCEPEAIKITATTSSIPTKQYQSNKTVEDKKMKPETLTELLEQVAEKVEKDVAQVCITIVKQYENGNEIARDIAEKFGINLEDIE